MTSVIREIELPKLKKHWANEEASSRSYTLFPTALNQIHLFTFREYSHPHPRVR